MLRNSVLKNSEAGHNRAGMKVTLAGSVVNLALVFLKFTAGYFGHSQALIADAVHSISDLFTDVAVLFGLQMREKEPDRTHHYGHARFETLMSAAVGLTLAAAGVYIGVEAGRDIYFHRQYHPTWITVVAALISIISKEILYRFTITIGRRMKSSAITANAWHHRSDAMSSVAVLLGVVGAQIREDWHVLDAFAALVVSFLVLGVAFRICWDALKELTDTAPRPEVQKKIVDCVWGVDGVLNVHDLRVRSSGGLLQMEVHVVVAQDLTVAQGHSIAKTVESCVKDEVENVGTVLIHVDPGNQGSP
jgi:cation diffusion facilitator family transporter